MTQMNNPSITPERRFDIDWLRILAVLLLFLFHTARIFDVRDPWYVKNEQLSEALTYLLYYVHPWHMALLFLLAGASTWFALHKRNSAQYIKERFVRLLIPFIFGMLVIVPPQVYYDLLQHASFKGSYFQVYFQQFMQNPKELGCYATQFDPGHLWFIFFLVLFSIIALPLFLYFRRESGSRVTKILATFFSKPAMIFLLALPLYGSELLLGHHNPLFYLIAFIYGFILMADHRFAEAIDKYKFPALIIGPILYLIVPYFNVVGWPKSMPQWLSPILKLYTDGFIPWLFIFAWLGYGKKLLNFSNRFLKYWAEASYPVYILHQTIIVVIGFYVVQLGVGVGLKYVIALIAAFAGTVILYDLIVKRLNAIRFLFGMRLKR